MSLIPFRKEGQISLRELQEEMNGLLARVWHAGLSTGPFDGQDWAPTVDVIEEDDRFVVRTEVPGLDVADIELTFSEGNLVIKGRKSANYTDEQSKRLIRHERRFGAFCRSVSLPAAVKAERITATCQKGLLEVTLPKTEECRPKPIKIDLTE